MCKHTTRYSPAFTLVELLVVIAIIGILIGLLLPAVQSAREAARRMQCTNHIKQIVLSVHNYENVRHEMPIGLYGAPAEKQDATDEGFGFLAMLLPYMEQSALHDQLQPGERWEDWLKKYRASTDKAKMKGVFTLYHEDPANAGTVMPGGDTVISFFKCPTSILPRIAPESFEVQGYKSLPLAKNIVGYATSDYKGCGGSDGPNFDGGDGKNNGVLMKNAESNGSVTFSSITDGLSNTLMIAESSYAPADNLGEMVDDYPTWIGGQYNDEQVRVTGEKNSIINLGPYKNLWFVANGSKNAVNDDNAYSQHTGGANFGLCDGSVRFISENISQETYNYLHGRNDGKSVGGF